MEDCDDHAMPEGNVTKKSDEATTPFAGTGMLFDTAADGSWHGWRSSTLLREECLRGNDDDDDDDGTTTMTSRADPVADPKGD